MSLRTTKDKIRQLNWDPSKTEAEEGETSRFEWAIDHERQVGEDWCWAACMSNALTCFGRYVNQADIVDRYFKSHGFPKPPDNKGIPSPEPVVDLWRSFGFGKPTWRDKPIPFKALAKEIATHGPVLIELWREGEANTSHFALIHGISETAAGPRVFVSDPYSPAPQSRTYDEIRGSDPLPSKFGEWRRTYLNQGFQRGYLRRFFGQPTKYLGGLAAKEEVAANNDAEPPLKPANANSALTFELPPNPLALFQELALASYGYRHYRYRIASGKTRDARLADLGSSLFLFESIPVWRSPSVIRDDQKLKDQLSPQCWHHQIYDAHGPRYYAQTVFFEELQQRLDSGWRTGWMGERWMAKRVDKAIQELDNRFGDRKEQVRMVEFNQYELFTLYLIESDLHLIVSVHSKQRKNFPLLTTFTDDQLKETLRVLSA